MRDEDFWNLIRGRRSIRRYQQRDVPRAMILQLLEAARWAPSAHNRQPWRFAVIPRGETRRHLVEAMADRWVEDLRRDGLTDEEITRRVERSRQRLLSAPVLILLALSMVDMDTYPDPARQQAEYIMAVQSTALAAQNLMLAAHHLGLGSCWICAPLFVPDVVRAVLDLPEDWIAQAFISVGYPAEHPQKDRHPLHEHVLWVGEKGDIS